MSYRITITKFEVNPEYEKQREERRYSNFGPMPEPEISLKQLETVVTDEEFKAIKKAVLEVM